MCVIKCLIAKDTSSKHLMDQDNDTIWADYNDSTYPPASRLLVRY